MPILYIDSNNEHHKGENDLCLTPTQLDWVEYLRKHTFDEIHVHNTKSSDLTHRRLFYLHGLLKHNGIMTVLIDQKISVLQDLDAEEIFSNGKLAGFENIEINNFEKFVKDSKTGNDVRQHSLVVTMIRDE